MKTALIIISILTLIFAIIFLISGLYITFIVHDIFTGGIDIIVSGIWIGCLIVWIHLYKYYK